MKKKTVALLLSLALIIGITAGGTIAWLTAQTDTVENTFVYGDINIDLTETGTDDNGKKEYKILPGNDLEKDPKVTVKAGSEECWVFVKVVEANWPNTITETDGSRKVNYAIANGWTQLGEDETSTDGETITRVYYRSQDSLVDATADVVYSVLADDQVTVSKNLTKDELKDIVKVQPTLTFTAYAIQKDENIANETTAWNTINGKG